MHSTGEGKGGGRARDHGKAEVKSTNELRGYQPPAPAKRTKRPKDWVGEPGDILKIAGN